MPAGCAVPAWVVRAHLACCACRDCCILLPCRRRRRLLGNCALVWGLLGAQPSAGVIAQLPTPSSLLAATAAQMRSTSPLVMESLIWCGAWRAASTCRVGAGRIAPSRHARLAHACRLGQDRMPLVAAPARHISAAKRCGPPGCCRRHPACMGLGLIGLEPPLVAALHCRQAAVCAGAGAGLRPRRTHHHCACLGWCGRALACSGEVHTACAAAQSGTSYPCYYRRTCGDCHRSPPAPCCCHPGSLM